MRCCRVQTCAAVSGGSSQPMEPSSSPPRTKRNWQKCGGNGKEIAKPWLTRKWLELYGITLALEKSAKSNANLPTSLTRERWGVSKTPPEIPLEWILYPRNSHWVNNLPKYLLKISDLYQTKIMSENVPLSHQISLWVYLNMNHLKYYNISTNLSKNDLS